MNWFSWSLNDNLLADSVCSADINWAICEFSNNHANDTTHPLVKWVALKCTLLATRSLAQKTIFGSLLSKIASLESFHKKRFNESLSPQTL